MSVPRGPVGEDTGCPPDEDRAPGYDQADVAGHHRSTVSDRCSGMTADVTETGVGLGTESAVASAKAMLETEVSIGTSGVTSATAGPTSRLLRTLRALRHLHGLLVELKRRATS